MATQEIEIHGHKVEYDDESESAKRGVKFLKEKLDRDEAKVYFDAAKRHPEKHTRFEVHDHHGDGQHDMTMTHNDDGSFTVRKRTPH